MTETRTQALEELAAEWEDMARGTSQFDAALRVCALKVREVLAAYPEQEPVYEWGALFYYHPEMNTWSGRREDAQAELDEYPEHGGKLYRRTKAGQWEEVQ